MVQDKWLSLSPNINHFFLEFGLYRSSICGTTQSLGLVALYTFTLSAGPRCRLRCDSYLGRHSSGGRHHSGNLHKPAPVCQHAQFAVMALLLSSLLC
jgi:hypothetical protein